MALTTAQRATLKAYVQANGALNSAWLAGNMAELERHFNALAVPDFTVWKTNVPIADVGMRINGAELGGLTQVNNVRLQTIALYLAAGVNPSLADHRAFFDDIFSGSGGVNTRAALLILWKRLATNAEKLFSTGTGSNAVPATLSHEGYLSDGEIQAAMQS